MAVECDHNTCIQCAGCVGTCPYSAIDYIEGKIVVDAEKCIDCNICVKFCPVSALAIPGKPLPRP